MKYVAVCLLFFISACQFFGVPTALVVMGTIAVGKTVKAIKFWPGHGSFLAAETNTKDFSFGPDGNGALLEVDPEHGVQRRLGEGHLHNPLGFAVQDGGLIAVADLRPESFVVVFRGDGSFLNEIAAPNSMLTDCAFSGPRLFCVDADLGGSGNCKIWQINNHGSPQASATLVLDSAAQGCAHANTILAGSAGELYITALGTDFPDLNAEVPDASWPGGNGGVYRWQPGQADVLRLASGGLFPDGLYVDHANRMVATDLVRRAGWIVSPAFLSPAPTPARPEPLWNAAAIVPQIGKCGAGKVRDVDWVMCGTFNTTTDNGLVLRYGDPVAKQPLSVDEHEEEYSAE